jgi:hypothetical protein
VPRVVRGFFFVNNQLGIPMGLFCADNKFEREALIEIMRISCEDWNVRYAEQKHQAIGIHDDSIHTLHTILDISEQIIDRLFAGQGSSAFKRVSAFMVVSCVYPFLFARTQGETDGLLNLAGNHIKNFQAYFNLESAPLLLALATQETEDKGTVVLDQWSGFRTQDMMDETWKFLVNTPKIAQTNKTGSIEYDGFIIGMEILALSLILENAYWASQVK